MEERIQREQRKLKTVNRMLTEENDTHWRRFMNIYSLLRDTGYLDEQDKPTKRGDLTAQIRSENEYAMAEVLLSVGVLDDLTAPQMAATLSALLNDSNRENLYVKYRLSNEVMQALAKIDLLFQRVDRLQRKHRVEVGILLNAVASGLVEAWANGYSWERLIGMTNIGEGDMVRQFRRTADILRQISRIDALPLPIRLTAKEALKLIDREPIKEVELAEAPLAEPIEETTGLSSPEERAQFLKLVSVDSSIDTNTVHPEKAKNEPDVVSDVDSLSEASFNNPEPA